MNNNRLNMGRTAGIAGIILNIVLFAVKCAVGVITGGISVITDAVNNLSDAGSSAFVFVGYWLSGKPADKKHPYGHARIEHLCGLFISVIVTVLGVEFFRDSIEKFFSGGSTADFSAASVIVMGCTVLVKGAMALFYRRVAIKIDSQSLRAAAIDSIGDIFATLAVIAGMLLSPYTGVYTDAVLGCVISLYIIFMGLKLVKESSDTLIGTAPDTEFVAEIAQKIRSFDGVVGIHDLVVHSYGAGRCFISAHVEVDAAVDVMESHDLIDNIEFYFSKERNIDLVIHMDPVQYSDERVRKIKGKVEEVISLISSEYSSPASMHDFRVVFGVTHSNLIFDIAISSDFPVSDEKLCEVINGEIKKLDGSYNSVITVDRDYSSNRFGEKK